MLLVGLCISLLPSISQAIDTPGNARGSVVSDGTVRWEWNGVAGAQSYNVIVDGEGVGTTTELSFTSQNLSQGEHTMSVKAIDFSWNYSPPTNNVTVTVGASQNTGGPSGSSGPGAPSGTQVGDGAVRWQWPAASDAILYEVTVNGQVEQITAGLDFTSQNLWAGEHSMSFRAIDRTLSYSARSPTAVISVPNGFDPNNPATTGGSSVTFNDAPAPAPTPVVAAPAPPPPAPAEDNGMIDPQTWTKPGLPSQWELTFSDEFDNFNLNPNRWNAQLRWDGEWNGERYEYRIINGEAQMYVNILSPDQDHLDYLVPVYNPFEFNGSRLAIRAVRNPLREGNFGIDHGPLREVARQQEFLSGAISTHDKFSQKYGRFEARIKIPSEVGTFPAFWLYHQRQRWENTQRTEIDIMENLGHAPHFIYNSFHYHTEVSPSYSGNANFIKPSPSGQIFTGVDFSQDYHVYAVEWSPGYVAWFVDDQKVSEMWNGNVDYEELYVIANLAMGGNWANFPVNSGGLGRPPYERYPTDNDVNIHNNPALEIDYIRVYKPR